MCRTDIFADVCNFYIYGGRQIINPANLHPLDSTEAFVSHKSSKPNSDKTTIQNIAAAKQYRDVLKKAVLMQDDQNTYLIIGVENQTYPDYSMPVRSMVYDAMQYNEQLREIRQQHKQKKDDRSCSAAEYLSGFYRTDKLKPVITLVVYFSTDKWDAALCLYDMLEPLKPEVAHLVTNYKINLIQPYALSEEDLNKFRTNFGLVMKFMKYADNPEKIDAMLEEEEEQLKELSTDAALLLSASTGLDLDIDEESKMTNMCKGMKILLERSREEGLQQGREEGRHQGRKENLDRTCAMLYEFIQTGVLSVASAVSAAAKFGISEEEFLSGLNKDFSETISQ